MSTNAVFTDSASETQFLPPDKEYRRTGILPVEKTDEEILAEQDAESAPAGEVEHPETKAEPAESAPAKVEAVESATTQRQKTKETTAKRFQEILAEVKTLKEQLAAKTPAQAQQTAPPPVTEVKEPQMSEFKTMGEYLTAVREFAKKQAITAAKGEWESAQTRQRQEEQAKTIASAWEKKSQAGQKKYADFAEVALNPDLPIPVGSVTYAFLHDSDHGADVLYHLGSNPDKLAEISAMPPLKAARALYAIESEVSKAPSAPAVSKAPPPPNQVSGKGTTSASAVEKAIEDGDFEAYRKAENAKALARLKRK